MRKLSSFWKAAEVYPIEEVDPIEEEPEWIAAEPLDSNCRKLPDHFLHLDSADAFTQYSGFHVPWSYRDLKEWTSVETLMTNNNGGIIDILIVSKKNKRHLHIVANTSKVLNEVQIMPRDGFYLVHDCHKAVYTPKMPLIGLEARECLRIEAGKCLPGKDTDEQTTPVEAELMHLISERKMRDGSFPGSERILKEFRDNNPSKRRRGFISEDGRLRSGDIITSTNGHKIGYVSSCTYSPILKSFIAMGSLEIEVVLGFMKFVKEDFINHQSVLGIPAKTAERSCF
ncbi:unnamed protein product [Larinioides sclopetarius]|uniref:Aminomethyltransferase C-terminal domain-containing protein n=1 Tax=Larinioides sclopetarius TaxID=280406 RepID=A0AAV1Z6H4_9ARAC